MEIFSKGDPWIHLPKVSGWGYSKDFPRPAARTFRSRFRKFGQSIQGGNGLTAVAGSTALVRSIVGQAVNIPSYKCIDNFASELEALGGNFILCRLDEVRDKILEILRIRGIDQLMVWDTPYIPEKLTGQLSEAGIKIIHPTGETLETSCLVRAGLTGAFAGITKFI
jgi:hypothetical protein